MTTGLLDETEGRIEAALGSIDRDLRPRAVAGAAYQALLLTDGQVGTDMELAVALCRVAAQRVRGLTKPQRVRKDPWKRPGGSRVAPITSTSPSSRCAARNPSLPLLLRRETPSRA